MPDYPRIYAKQEYLTPGAADTVEILAAAARLDASARVVEVAFGKGEAACTLASRFGCRVVGVDRSVPFIAYTAAKVRTRGLAGLVSLLHADGRRLPLPDASFNAGYCIGAPSIVGLEECLRELHRVVRPGGVAAVSDVVWRQKPDAPLGEEWGWVAQQLPQVSAEEYAALIESAGLIVERTLIHPRADWDAYHTPMAAVAAEARAQGDHAFAEQMEQDHALEQRAVDAFWDYASFLARRE